MADFWDLGVSANCFLVVLGCLVFGGGGLVYFSVWRWFWGLRFLLCVGFSVGWSAGTVLRFVGLVGVGFWCLCALVGGLIL